MSKKDLRGTWSQALISFFGPLLLILLIRWFLLEPFVIPSGSMLPTLLVHEHIVVNKLSFGLRNPFANDFLLKWARPHRGEILVFKYPHQPDVFYVKRVQAVGGDRIQLRSGQIFINGTPVHQDPSTDPGDGFEYLLEDQHLVRYLDRENSNFEETLVPEGHFFVIGDNRDQSSDSRSWGFVPESHIVGKAVWTWLSCDQMLVSAPFLCDPATLRWGRMFQSIDKKLPDNVTN